MESGKLKIFVGQVTTQCEFVCISAQGLDVAVKNQDLIGVFYYIQALLTASANVSRLLWGQDGNSTKAKLRRAERQAVRDVFHITDESILVTQRKMRNNSEHFDERIDAWWERPTSTKGGFVDMNYGKGVGSSFSGDALVKTSFFRAYDTTTATLTFWDQKYSTKEISAEAYRLLLIGKQRSS